MHIVSLSRPVTEGRLIKRLQTRGGMRWPGVGASEMRRSFPSRRFKPRGAWRARRTPGDLMAVRPGARQGSLAGSNPHTVESRPVMSRADERTTTGDRAEQTD